MTWLGVTSTVRAHRFHQWTYQPRQPPRTQMFDLIHLESSSSADVVESIILDHYQRYLPKMFGTGLVRTRRFWPITSLLLWRDFTQQNLLNIHRKTNTYMLPWSGRTNEHGKTVSKYLGKDEQQGTVKKEWD